MNENIKHGLIIGAITFVPVYLMTRMALNQWNNGQYVIMGQDTGISVSHGAKIYNVNEMSLGIAAISSLFIGTLIYRGMNK